MTVRELIAHGGHPPLPTRAAPSVVRALPVARGSPPWTPWTILCRLDLHHPSYATCIRVDSANRCDPHADPIGRVRSVITITGIGDHLRPEWPITITGIRTRYAELRATNRSHAETYSQHFSKAYIRVEASDPKMSPKHFIPAGPKITTGQ